MTKKKEAKAKAEAATEEQPKVDKLVIESRKMAAKVLSECGLPKELIKRIESDEPMFIALANALADERERDRELRAVVTELADVAPEITKLEESLDAMQSKVKNLKNDLDLAYKREHEAVKRLRAIQSGEYQSTIPLEKPAKSAPKAEASSTVEPAQLPVSVETLVTVLEDMASRDECEKLAALIADPKIAKTGLTPARVAKSVWNSTAKETKELALSVLDRLCTDGPFCQVAAKGGKVEFHLK